jgi:hypothetical protein
MTFYDLWLDIRNEGVAKRSYDEHPSEETIKEIYIKFNGQKIEKKIVIGNTIEDWHEKNLNDVDITIDTWELI